MIDMTVKIWIVFSALLALACLTVKVEESISPLQHNLFDMKSLSTPKFAVIDYAPPQRQPASANSEKTPYFSATIVAVDGTPVGWRSEQDSREGKVMKNNTRVTLFKGNDAAEEVVSWTNARRSRKEESMR